MANRLSGFLVVGLSLGFAACGGESLTLPSEGEPAAIAVSTGDGQNGRVGTQLATPLTVLVTDTKNRPVAGATVEFDFTQGGGQANPASAVTGNDGQASSLLTLGTQVGPVSGIARVPVPAGRVPVQTTFTATAISSDANGIALVSGDNQTGLVGTTLALPLVVQVTDGFGNPISNIPIQWSVGLGGGQLSETSNTTDVNGVASVERTLGATAGAQTTLATAPGLAGSPVTFTHIANAGNVSSVVKISGDVGSAAAGSMVALVVEVRDAGGNPISAAPVNWVVGEGGGNVTPANNTTGTDGRAGAQWTLGSAPGTNTLTAVSGGATATFTITGTGTGSPSKLAIVTQPPSSVAIGQILSPAPVVQIKDNAGHDVDVPGVDITVVLKSAGSARLEGTLTVTSDANGRATFSDLKVTGATGSRQLLFTADGYTSVTSTKFDVFKASSTTTITGDGPDPSVPGQSIHVTFTVTGMGGGTPTGTVTISSQQETGGCTVPVGQGSCDFPLDESGVQHLQATYSGDSQFEDSSDPDGEDHEVTNLPPTAAFDAPTTCTAGAPCPFDGSSSSDSGGTIATWSWDFGDILPVDDTGSGSNPSYTYSLAGTYSVTLTVTDNLGATNAVTHDVIVQ